MKKGLAPLAAAIVAAAAVRWFVLFREGGPVIDADEAIVGLMARHILEGRPWPLYYYGQNYLGALEAWCVAAAFALFGTSPAVLKAVPGAFSLLCVALIYRLGSRALSPAIGLLGAFLFAVPPSGLAIWSLKARGGFIELVAIGTAALTCADAVLRESAGPSKAFFLGCLLGLGWWVNQQILYYALPIALWAALRYRDDDLLRRLFVPAALGFAAFVLATRIGRPEAFGARLALAGLLVAGGAAGGLLLGVRRAATFLLLAMFAGIADELPGFAGHPLRELAVVGTAIVVASLAVRTDRKRPALPPPILLAILCGSFSWWNPRGSLYGGLAFAGLAPGALRGLAERPRLAAALLGLLLGSLPFWIGLAQRGTAVFDVVRAAGGSSVISNLFGFVSVSLPMLVGARPFWGEVDFAPGLSVALVALYVLSIPAFWRSGPGSRFLGAFLLGIPLVFAASAFGWFRKEPRYLLPIYSALFFLPASLATEAIRAGRQWLGGAVVASVLFANLFGLAHSSRSSDLLLLTATERVAEDHRELLEFLRARGLRHVYTDYWIGYRLAFESNEEIVFAPYRQPSTERIPEYGREVRRAGRAAWVAPPSLARIFSESLDALGVAYHEASASGYRILFDLASPEALGCRPLPLGVEELRASRSPGETRWAVDGDLATRWATHAPQKPGEWFEIALPEARRLCWLEVSVGDFVSDYPRALGLRLETQDGTWQTLADPERAPALHVWLESGRLDVNLAGRFARRLRLELEGADEVFDWSIAELRLWEEPSGAFP